MTRRSAVLLAFFAGCSKSDDVGEPPDTTPDPTATAECCQTVQLSVELTPLEHEGYPVFYYAPPDPVGAVWIFHGTNGSLTSIRQVEWLQLYNLLVAENVALVATISTDKEAQQWDTSGGSPSTNADFPRLDSLHDRLDAETSIAASLPVVALGFSNGGAYSGLFAELADESAWNVAGFDAHNSAPHNELSVPGLVVSAVNDPGGGPEELQAYADFHAESGAESLHLRGTEVALHPNRFALEPEYSADQSQQIFDELVTLGYVAADGSRLASVDDVDATLKAYEQASGAPYPEIVSGQLRVVWATHRFSAQHAAEERDILLRWFGR